MSNDGNLFALSKKLRDTGITYRLLRLWRGKGFFASADPASVADLVIAGFTPVTAGDLGSRDRTVITSGSYVVTVERAGA